MSRRALLFGTAAGVSMAAVGAGVESGLRSKRRSQVPPRATPDYGIACWISPGKPSVQVFFNPVNPTATEFIKNTSDAWLELSDRVSLTHYCHWNDTESFDRANELACADIVGRYWDVYSGVPVDDERLKRLVAEKACTEFVKATNQTVKSSFITTESAVVYVDGRLVPEIGAQSSGYTTADSIAARLGLD